MQNVEKQAIYLSHRMRDVEELSGQVSAGLESLRGKILSARQAANRVKISITTDWEETMGCIRTYRVDSALKGSLVNKISVVFAVDESEARSGLILYWPSTKDNHAEEEEEEAEREFLALEMVDRRIHFLWNVGGGVTHVVKNNVTLDTARNLKTDDHMWYKITAERIGNIGRLNVRKVKPEYDSLDYHRWAVGGENHPNHLMFDINADDPVYVGGVPDLYRSSRLQTSGHFVGVLASPIEIDGNSIGVWNFVSNRGCRETHIGPTEVRRSAAEHNCFNFGGKGSYAAQTGMRNYDPRYLSVSLEFRSFDENALLLFIVNKGRTQYLSLSLRNGKVHLIISYARQSVLIFESTKTYNGGNWVSVEAARALRNELETGVLRVTFNGQREDLMNTIDLRNPLIGFHMDECDIYFGGIPPTFDRTTFPDVDFGDGYLGGIRSITVSNPGSNSIMNPLYAERRKLHPYHKVSSHCGDEETVDLVSFEEETAFVELQSRPLKRISKFGFIFRTVRPDGLLLLSTYQRIDDSELDNFYSVALKDGKLHLFISSSVDPANRLQIISGETTFHDGALHGVVVERNGRRVRLSVDDRWIATGNLGSHIGDISAPREGGLFLGGVPGLIELAVLNGNMAASVDGFAGSIRQLSFLDDDSIRIASFKNPVGFSNAIIGRDVGMNREEHYQRHQEEADACSPGGSGFLSGIHAARFSRHMSSSMSIKLRKEELQRDFEIELKLRTFDQDGLVLASVNRKNYLFIYLQDSELRVEYGHHGGRIYETEITDVFNNGRWKSIRLMKRDIQMTLVVDRHKSASMQVPRKMHLNKHIWLGGLDERERSHNAHAPQVPQFDGCLKDLTVSGRKIALNSPSNRVNEVSLCAENVEVGFHLADEGGSIDFEARDGTTNSIQIEVMLKILGQGEILSLYNENFNSTLLLTSDNVVSIHKLQ